MVEGLQWRRCHRPGPARGVAKPHRFRAKPVNFREDRCPRFVGVEHTVQIGRFDGDSLLGIVWLPWQEPHRRLRCD